MILTGRGVSFRSWISIETVNLCRAAACEDNASSRGRPSQRGCGQRSPTSARAFACCRQVSMFSLVAIGCFLGEWKPSTCRFALFSICAFLYAAPGKPAPGPGPSPGPVRATAEQGSLQMSRVRDWDVPERGNGIPGLSSYNSCLAAGHADPLRTGSVRAPV
jgi:hypothetical protein